MSLYILRKTLRKEFNYLKSGDSYVDDWYYILQLEEQVINLRLEMMGKDSNES